MHSDNAGVVWTPLDGSGLVFEVESSSGLAAGEPADPAVEAAWAALLRENPRHFNGPILAVAGVDAAGGVLRLRRDEYKRLAVQPTVATGVVQLGVTGVLTAHDAAGRAFALLGRRSVSTRVFGGQWELGPSGGVEPPEAGVSSFGVDRVLEALAGEVREEIGLAEGWAGAEAVGLLHDTLGRSVEVVVRVRLARPLAAYAGLGRGVSWEYEGVLWVAVDDRAGLDGLDATAATRVLWSALFGG